MSSDIRLFMQVWNILKSTESIEINSPVNLDSKFLQIWSEKAKECTLISEGKKLAFVFDKRNWPNVIIEELSKRLNSSYCLEVKVDFNKVQEYFEKYSEEYLIEIEQE